MDEPDLSGLFEHGPAATDAALRDVVARRDRRRVRHLQRLGAAGVVAAVAIAAASLAATRPGPGSTDAAKSAAAIRRRTPVAPLALSTGGAAFRAAGSAAVSAPVACPMDAPCAPINQAAVLFKRRVGGIALAAARATAGVAIVPQPQLPTAFRCAIGAALDVTVTAGATTQQLVVANPSLTSAPLEVVSTMLIAGGGEHAAVVVLRTSAMRGTVVAHFSNGTSDEMRAVDGWAALVDVGQQQRVGSDFGSVTVLGANGQQLARTTLQRLPGVAVPGECLRPQLPVVSPATDTTTG